jgi:excisionase family DNA binding protein
MEVTTPQLLSLPALAKALNLPEGWLRAEADAGRIPHLRVGKRYRFNLGAVIHVLSERAAKDSSGDYIWSQADLDNARQALARLRRPRQQEVADAHG